MLGKKAISWDGGFDAILPVVCSFWDMKCVDVNGLQLRAMNGRKQCIFKRVFASSLHYHSPYGS